MTVWASLLKYDVRCQTLGISPREMDAFKNSTWSSVHLEQSVHFRSRKFDDDAVWHDVGYLSQIRRGRGGVSYFENVNCDCCAFCAHAHLDFYIPNSQLDQATDLKLGHGSWKEATINSPIWEKAIHWYPVPRWYNRTTEIPEDGASKTHPVPPEFWV